MDDIQLFLAGRKPAVYNTVLSERFINYLPRLLEEYPYIDKGIDLFHETKFYLFFKHEELKLSFQERLKNVGVPSLEFHRLLGLTLGYPPKAVDFYVKCEGDSKLASLKVGMHYQGVSCNGNVYDLVENCNWLWDTYSFPDLQNDPLEVRIRYNMHSVKWRDIERLKELQQIVFDDLSVSAKLSG